MASAVWLGQSAIRSFVYLPQASYDDNYGGEGGDLSSVTFNAEDFPTVSSANGSGPSSGMRPVGLWAGYAGKRGLILDHC